MTKVVWSTTARLAIAALAFGAVSCGELTRQGQSPAYLVIESLAATSPSSDVFTGGGILPDLATVTLTMRLKDPGPPINPTTPSPNNAITVNRYRVTYIRADGRNTPGVDVPYPFDGAFTVTVSGSATGEFTLVRQQAKAEAPLAALRFNQVIISTIAEVTFYGFDQTGREVITTGRVSVNFGNFAD